MKLLTQVLTCDSSQQCYYLSCCGLGHYSTSKKSYLSTITLFERYWSKGRSFYSIQMYELLEPNVLSKNNDKQTNKQTKNKQTHIYIHPTHTTPPYTYTQPHTHTNGDIHTCVSLLVFLIFVCGVWGCVVVSTGEKERERESERQTYGLTDR